MTRELRKVGLRLMGNPQRVRPMLNRLRRRVHDWWRGETDATFYELWNLQKLKDLFQAYGHAPLSADPGQVEVDSAGACRWILARLAGEPSLRRRYPQALSAGLDGGFAAWLLNREARQLRFSERAISNLRAVFSGQPDALPRLCWSLRPDLRQAFPLGLTPHPNRGQFLDWMLSYGREDFDLQPEQAIWFLGVLDESSDRGLLQCYTYSPQWQQAVPEGATSLGWPKLIQYLRREYGLAGRWVDRAKPQLILRPSDEIRILQSIYDSVPAPTETAILKWLHERSELATPSKAWRQALREDLDNGLARKPGVNLLGHFDYPSGLQEAALGVAEGLNQAGWRVAMRDLSTPLDALFQNRVAPACEIFDTTIQVTAVNTFPDDWYPRIGLAPRADSYRIAVWYWELEELPQEWLERLRWADEVWAPTSFLVDTFRKYLQAPVVAMLPGLELPAFTPKTRADFGLPTDRFLFYFSFDMGSVMERKNPLGLIKAFRQAFHPDEPVHLVIKCSRGHTDEESLAKLQSAADAAGVTIMNRVLTRSDTLAMLNLADCYISLHRSEGLGLGMAESMLLGKPVIASRYSGNLDFMTEETSYLVDTGRIPIEQESTPSRPYPKGCLWGDPCLEHAAALMRQVYENPEEAKERGRKAKEYVQARLNLKAYGERMATRLKQIRNQGAGRPREGTSTDRSPSS